VERGTNGCVESGPYEGAQQIEETLEALVPAVAGLIKRSAGTEDVACEAGDTGYRFSAPVYFPDAIGGGSVVARLFHYRDRIRIDVEIVHNRVFAKADGTPSDRRCYMNDFVASVTTDPDVQQLPPDFERSVLRGVRGAREGVRRHNREQTSPWNQVKVAAAE
jgi:hypothetical protein